MHAAALQEPGKCANHTFAAEVAEHQALFQMSQMDVRQVGEREGHVPAFVDFG